MTIPGKDASSRQTSVASRSRSTPPPEIRDPRFQSLLEILVELGFDLSAAEASRDAALLILHAADRLFGFDACAVDLCGENNVTYSLVTMDVVDGVRQEVPTEYHEIRPDSMFRMALDHGPQIILRDPASPQTPASERLRSFGVKSRRSASLLFVPVRCGSDNIGLITIQSYKPYCYTRDDLKLLQILADYCGGALARSFAEERFRQSEEQLRLIIEQIPALLWTTDADFRLTTCLGHGLHGLGLDPDEMVGRSIHEFFGVCDPLAPHITLHQRALAGEQLSQEIPWGRRFYRATLQPLLDASGATAGCIGVAYDITMRREAEERREEALLELERSNKDLEQFAYVASHDLQEPLRMVSSYVQLLARRYKGKLDADADEFIHFAVDGAKRMQDLISDLLTYSRVESRPMEFRQADMDALFADAVANLRTSIQETGATVTCGTLPAIQADPVQMRQLFQNLIGNGIKFRREGVAPQIAVSAQMQSASVVFSVRDNGIGIPAECFDRIFVIFQRLQNREDYPGTGIGLALCKKIVQRHRGRIWPESIPGQGSIFFFEIPLVEVSPE